MYLDLKLGLIADRYISQLQEIMEYSRTAFNARPDVSDFFQTINLALKEEKKRRQKAREDCCFEITIFFNLEKLNPVALICLESFFARKQKDFFSLNPPLSAFFKQLEDFLATHVETQIPRHFKTAVEAVRDSYS